MRIPSLVIALAGVLFPAGALADALPLAHHVCPDGLEVVVSEMHSSPLVTVEEAAHEGAMTEDDKYNGVSHLYEHMFFKGNQVIPNQEAYLARTRDLGMVFNGSTETERVNYYFTTTSDKTEPSLELLRDSVERPLFDPKELEREKEVVVGEIDRDDSDPGYHFHKALDDRLWKFPSYKDPLGDRATVRSATPAMMRTIQQRYYVPNNSVLVVSGDVQPTEIFALAEKLFGPTPGDIRGDTRGWERAADPFAAHPVLVEPPLERSQVVVVQQPVQTVALAFEWEGPSTVGNDADATYAADLLTAMIEQPASRFQRDLVDSGDCVRAEFEWYTQRYVGPITLGLEAAPGKEDICLKAAVAELPILAQPDTFTDDELHDGLTKVLVDRAQEQESPSSYSHLLTFWWSSAGLDYYEGYPEAIGKVTRRQIAAYLERFVLGQPYVFGVMLAPSVAKREGLDERHFERLLDLSASKTLHVQTAANRGPASPETKP
jgi:zinc protease